MTSELNQATQNDTISKPVDALTITEIREQNALHLSQAIVEGGKALINQIDFSDEKDDYAEVTRVDILDRAGKSIPCEVGFISRRKFAADGNTRVREFGIIVAPVGKLRIADYIQDLTFEITDSEVATRTWKFLTRSSSQNINVFGSVEVHEQYDGLGLGQTLVTVGEMIKTEVAHKLATALGKESIVSHISDGTDNGWTARQAAKLPGYVINSLSSTPHSFTKTEDEPFS